MTVRSRMLIVGVAVPLGIALVGVALALLALPTLPDPIVVHWNAQGTPDGFGPAWPFPLLLLGVGLGWAGFAFAVARTVPATGRPTINQRVILSIGYFLTVVMTVTFAGTLLIQRGLEDARDAPSVLPLIIGAFGSGILLAVVAWFLLPRHAPTPLASQEDLPVLTLAATERGIWIEHVAPKRAIAGLVIGIVVVSVVAGCIGLWFVAPAWVFVLYAVLAIALTVLVIGSLHWTVTVDPQGFRAVSVVGFPRFTVPLAHVESAAAIELKAGRDFGGYGVRWGGRRRFGIITRSGEALEVRRTDGRVVVVTVRNPAIGAALLNSLAQRLD